MVKKILLGLGILILISIGYYYLWFLRQPDRVIPMDEHAFISPANGEIVAITPWKSDELQWEKDDGVVKVLTEGVGETGWLVAIEMDVTNVHYQRAPVDSRLIAEEYTEGKFNNALIQTNKYGFRVENERNVLTFEADKGYKYKVVQVAGLVARRIEDYLKPNQEVKRGEVIGLIKLGSQVAVILPQEVKPKVEIGDIVTDGETILARVEQ